MHIMDAKLQPAVYLIIHTHNPYHHDYHPPLFHNDCHAGDGNDPNHHSFFMPNYLNSSYPTQLDVRKQRNCFVWLNVHCKSISVLTSWLLLRAFEAYFGCKHIREGLLGLLVLVLSFDILIWLRSICAHAEEEDGFPGGLCFGVRGWIKIQPDRSFTPERNLLLPSLSNPPNSTSPYPCRFHRMVINRCVRKVKS